jgi:hypothetical protein
MSMSAPSRETIHVRDLDIEAILGQSSLATPCLLGPAAYFLGVDDEDEDEDDEWDDEEEGEEDDEDEDEDDLGWDDEDEDDADEDDE